MYCTAHTELGRTGGYGRDQRKNENHKNLCKVIVRCRGENSKIVADERILQIITHLVCLLTASTAYFASIAPRQHALHAQYHQPSSPA